MKKITKLLMEIQISLLTLAFAFPAQAAVYAGTPNSQPGSVVSLLSYAPAPTPSSGSVVSLRSYVPVSTQPVGVAPNTPIASIFPVPAPTPTPAQAPPSTPSSPGQVPNGPTNTGSSVLSLKGILKQSAPTSPASNQTAAPSVPDTTPIQGYPPILSVTSLSADEQLMVDMVNHKRAAAGLKPLAVDYRLVSVAVAKANDMKDNDYFNHISPTYGSPFAMMQAVGLNVRWAAENIAGNNSVAGAMAAFMKSPGHRANILDPRLTHIGVGIVYGTAFGNIYVQEFLQE